MNMNTRLTLKQLISASILAMALPLAAPAFAHDGQHEGKQSAHCERNHHGQKLGFSHHGNKDGVPHYLRGLDLSQSQKDQLFTLRHEQAPIVREQLKQRHELMQALRDTTQAQSFDDAKAQQIAAGLANLERDQVLMRARTQAKVFALLTPEQRTKARAFKHDRAHGERAGFKSHGKSHHRDGDQPRKM
jgi:periplasmic protein CpxP/Spy